MESQGGEGRGNIHTLSLMHMHTHARTHARMHTLTLTHSLTHTPHTHTHTYTHTHTHVYTHTHTHTHTEDKTCTANNEVLQLGERSYLFRDNGTPNPGDDMCRVFTCQVSIYRAGIIMICPCLLSCLGDLVGRAPAW